MLRATSRVNYPTALDAEAAFYEAFERADLALMLSVWADEEEVVCVHPDGARLTGYDQVSKSWADWFTGGRGKLHVHLSNQVYTQGMLLAVHNLHEHILVAGEPKARPPVIATNVYIRTSDGWRMLVHHASRGPLQQAPVTETGKILH